MTWICALGLIICLMGCQPRAYKAQEPPPPRPQVAKPKPPQMVAHPTLYVTINQLNLRSCPGLDCPKISSLALNTEVEKLGEADNWTQIRVKKDGPTGYVISRYLSPQPKQVAQAIKRKPKRAKPAKAPQPPEVVEGKKEAGPKKQ